jgi:hypothetical protein
MLLSRWVRHGGIRPKLGRANSNPTRPRFSRREPRWARDGSQTVRWCVDFGLALPIHGVRGPTHGVEPSPSA